MKIAFGVFCGEVLQRQRHPGQRECPAKHLCRELHSASQHHAARAVNCDCEHLAQSWFILDIPQQDVS